MKGIKEMTRGELTELFWCDCTVNVPGDCEPKEIAAADKEEGLIAYEEGFECCEGCQSSIPTLKWVRCESVTVHRNGELVGTPADVENKCFATK